MLPPPTLRPRYRISGSQSMTNMYVYELWHTNAKRKRKTHKKRTRVEIQITFLKLLHEMLDNFLEFRSVDSK